MVLRFHGSRWTENPSSTRGEGNDDQPTSRGVDKRATADAALRSSTIECSHQEIDQKRVRTTTVCFWQARCTPERLGGSTMNVLRGAMRLQAIAYGIYGLAFFFIPDFVLGTVFEWDTPSSWARGLGAIFIAVAWLEWSIAAKLEERRDLVWPFVLIPALLLVGVVWEKVADTYDGSDAYFSMVVAVTLFFTILIGSAALYAQREIPANA